MIFVQIAVAAAAAAVLFTTIACINRMTPATHHGIRAAYILIAAGVFGELMAIIDGHQPGVFETLGIVGLGMLSFLDRRAIARCPFVENKGDKSGR